MALPTSQHNVTVRKLSSTLNSYNTKVNTKLGSKTDKVSGATNGNFAGLDANGNLTDSGKKASNFATSAQGAKADSAIQGVKVEGSAITPDSNKVVNVTKSGLGLNNVTNDAQVKRSEMGVANGVATLDSNGKIPSSQIPGSYDDVVEGYYYNSKFYYDSAHTQEITPESDKVYVDVSANKTYRWSGTQYVAIGSDLALGETSSTAYRGDRGKAAYDHSQLTSGNPHNVSKSDVGLGSVVNTGDSATPVSGGTTKFTTGGAFTELAKKVDKENGKGLSTEDYTTSEKTKLSGISTGANKVEASSTNGKIKIDGTDTTVYSHPTTAGNKHIPSGGSSGQFLGYDSAGTAKWVNNPNTDTSVTDVANHYAPAEDAQAEKDASGGSATQLPTSSTGTLVQVVTGIKMDAKGHVTGVLSKGLWSPDNNTTYTNVKLGSGSATAVLGTSPAFTASLSNYSLSGGNGGFVFRYAGHKFCHFQMELNYEHRGWKQSRTAYNLHYIELPILMNINFGSPICRWFLNFGPQIGYCVKDESRTITHPFDCGLAAGTGFYVDTKAGLYQLEIRYDFSFGGVYGTTVTDNYTMASPMDLSINLAYMWHFKKKK